jgi:hypothetical protein
MMKQGLLLYADDPRRTLEKLIAICAAVYRKKLGVVPNVCYVHPSTFEGTAQQVGPVRVEKLPTVLKKHFWIGQESDVQ